MYINAQNNKGNTALMLACIRGHTDIVKLILYQNADRSLKNNCDNNILQIASENGNIEIVTFLLQYQYTLTVLLNEVNKNGDSPLMLACNNGYIELTNLLLNAGANKNISNKNSETALNIATKKKFFEIMELLK